jgi:hypothetical protein
MKSCRLWIQSLCVPYYLAYSICLSLSDRTSWNLRECVEVCILKLLYSFIKICHIHPSVIHNCFSIFLKSLKWKHIVFTLLWPVFLLINVSEMELTGEFGVSSDKSQFEVSEVPWEACSHGASTVGLAWQCCAHPGWRQFCLVIVPGGQSQSPSVHWRQPSVTVALFFFSWDVICV